MNLFYSTNIIDDRIFLSEDESRHCTQVLRYKAGVKINICDGRGNFYKGEIEKVEKRQVIVCIKNIEKVSKPRNYSLHIAIAPTKNIDRFEWFLEKATEIGIDEITPIITQNSERSRIRPDRLEKILVAAMKQSLKAYKPILNPISSIEDFWKMSKTDHQLLIAYCGDIGKKLLKNEYQKGSNAVIMIGPEGDFTEKEIENAMSCSYKPVSFGESRLRTETAGLVACHSVYLFNH